VDEEHPWGSGAGGRALEPFRSVAVDRDVIAIGTWLWVAELDGVAMPGDPPWGGFVHDGCVLAADTGGAIDGMQIDFFATLRAYYLIIDGELGLDEISLHEGGARCE
jgi:membrane-bound lytic murein transglycosylase